MFTIGIDIRNDKEGLTKEILEEHLEELITYIELTPSRLAPTFPSNSDCPEYIRQMRIINEEIVVFYHVLGILILQTGAVLPDRVKNVILEKDYLEANRFEGFEGFKKKIREYTSGHPLEKIRDIIKREKKEHPEYFESPFNQEDYYKK